MRIRVAFKKVRVFLSCLQSAFRSSQALQVMRSYHGLLLKQCHVRDCPLVAARQDGSSSGAGVGSTASCCCPWQPQALIAESSAWVKLGFSSAERSFGMNRFDRFGAYDEIS